MQNSPALKCRQAKTWAARGSGGGLVQGLLGEVLAQVVAHVLRRQPQPLHPALLASTVLGPPVLAHLLSGRKQFATFCAGNFLLVSAVLTNSLQ